MTARKSIRRSSRHSIQSQMSGVLNPNSSNSDEEDNPFWFKDFEDNSVTIRPSLRFGHVQDEAVLNSDSEPERTPLRKSWWKYADDTTEARHSMANASRERSSVSEKSLDASDLAVLNEGVAKPRSKMPRVKRKSSQGNLFTDILASTSRASSIREDTRNSESHDRESSVSLTDSSMDRIKQPPLKKKKKMTIRDLATGSNSGDDAPDIFQDALEALESGEDSGPGSTVYNQPRTVLDNIKSTGTTQSRQDSFGKGGVPSDISETTTGADSDLEGRKSPMISQSKKRTMFTKTRTRKSAHFNDLLMNVPSEDEPSIGGEPVGNQSKSGVESRQKRASRLAPGSDYSIEEDDSISDESVKKQRPTFPRKKRLTPEERIAAMFSDPDTSTRSEPIAERKTQEFVRPRDVSVSDIERRSLKQQQEDRSRRSGSLNLESGKRQALRTPVRRSSGLNESVPQSGKEINDRTPIASPAHVNDEKNQPGTLIRQSHGAHESDSDERSISEEEEDIGSLSHTGPVVEDNQPAKTAIRQSSVANKSADDRQSRKEAGDHEKSSRSEVEQNRSVRSETSRPDGANRSQKRSVNKENDRSRVSDYSDDDDVENEVSHGANESDDEEQTIMEEDDDVEETRQTRKSDRQSNRIDESDVVEDSQPPRKSRGQSSRVNEPDDLEEAQPTRKFHNRSRHMDESDLVEDSQPPRKSRGQPSRANEPDDLEEAQPTRKFHNRSRHMDESDLVEDSQPPRKSRGQPSRANEPDDLEEAQPTRKFHNRSRHMDESDVVEDSQPTRRSQGRPSRTDEPDEVEETQPERKSRSRSSRIDESDVVEDSQPVRKSRGGSSRANVPDEVEDSQPTRKSRSRSSRTDEPDEVEETQPAKKPRSRSSRIDESDVVEDSRPVRKSRGRSSRTDEPNEIEEAPPGRKSRSRLSRVDESGNGGEGESGDEEIALERSSVSPDAVVDGNSSPIISVRRSGSANRSRDSTQNKSQSKISEKRLNIENQSTPSRVEEKSTGQESPVSDDEKEDDEILERSENSSTSIRRSQMDPEDSPGSAGPKRRKTGPRDVEPPTQPISTPIIADKSGDRRKSSAIVPRRATSTHQPKKTVDNTTTNDKSQGGGGPGNTEINGSRFLSIQTTRADPASVSFANSGGREIVQQSKTSELFAGDKLTQLKAKLEEVKRQEAANLKYISERKAILKNAKIDSYFKTISGNSSAAAKIAKKTPTDPKPVNKAYIMNGKVLEWKKPKLSRPKKWATDRLYKFLMNKLEPKYDIRTRVRSEKFIKNLSDVAAIIQRRTKYENYKAELNQLLKEMAHLGIINTRNDFHLFCQDFLPYEFRIKVIPMLLPGDVRNIPFHPEKLHTPILDSLD